MKILLLLLPAFIFLSCTSAEIAGFKSPDFDGIPLNTIMVKFETDDLVLRSEVESEISSAFADNEHNCIQSCQLLSPAKNFTDQETDIILKKAGVQAILLISLKDSRQEKVKFIGNTTLTKEAIKVNADLTDTRENVNVWSGSANVNGNAFVKIRRIAYSLGQEVCKDLRKNKIIK